MSERARVGECRIAPDSMRGQALAFRWAFAVCLAGLGQPCYAAEDAEALYREAFTSPNPPVAGWRCAGQLSLLEAVPLPVRIPLEWTVRAEPFSFEVKLREAAGAKPAAPWWNWSYAGDELAVSRPEGKGSLKGFFGVDQPAWQWKGLPLSGSVPNVSHWLLGMLHVGQKAPDQVRFGDPAEGAPTIEAHWRDPLARYLGWTVSRLSVELEQAKRLPRRVRWYSDKDELVSETMYSQPRQLPSGRWAWLVWETAVAGVTLQLGGEGTLKIKQPVEKEVRVTPTLAWPKRTIRRTFRVTDDGFVVPQRVEMLGPSGQYAMDLTIAEVERLP